MKNGTYLSRDTILNAEDLKSEDIDVPEWGGKMRLREMTGADREEYAEAVSGRASHYREALIAFSAIDAQGNRVFTIEDVEALSRKSDRAIQRLAEAATRLSGIGRAAVEDARKNSSPEPSADSVSS